MKAAIPEILWTSSLPISKEAFIFHFNNGMVVFDNLDNKAVLIINEKYYGYNNGQFIGPYATRNEAYFWLKSV